MDMDMDARGAWKRGVGVTWVGLLEKRDEEGGERMEAENKEEDVIVEAMSENLRCDFGLESVVFIKESSMQEWKSFKGDKSEMERESL